MMNGRDPALTVSRAAGGAPLSPPGPPTPTVVVRKYTWGLGLAGMNGSVNDRRSVGGIGGLLACWDGGTYSYASDDRTFLYFYDGNGNVGQLMETTAGANYGTLAAKYEYDPYGSVTASSGTYVSRNPFRFSTKYWDDETGWGYWDARYYSPGRGRWLNRDPIEEAGGENLYGYVGNDPVDGLDPLGLVEITFTVTRTNDGKYSSLGTFEMKAKGLEAETVRGATLEPRAGYYDLGLGKGPKTYPIPPGTYKAWPWTYGRAWAIKLEDRKPFSGIYVHVGNFVWDTDGCILVGESKAADVQVDRLKSDVKQVPVKTWQRLVKVKMIAETQKDRLGQSDRLFRSRPTLAKMKKLYDDVKAKDPECTFITVIVVGEPPQPPPAPETPAAPAPENPPAPPAETPPAG